MYLMLGDQEITVIQEVCDSNTFTMYLGTERSLSATYDLFENNSLETTTLYNDDDTMYAVRSGYVEIDSFFYKPIDNVYIINLIKFHINDLRESVKQCNDKTDMLAEKIEVIQNGDFARQETYALMALAETFTDEQALKCILLFPKFDPNGVWLDKDKRLQYNGKLYKVLQGHTTQLDWTPDVAVSLYAEISDPSIEYPEFKQPIGSHDAYMTGDKVTYNGVRYESLIDNNVYSPDDNPSGWKKID